jgi:hypothetical protein
MTPENSYLLSYPSTGDVDDPKECRLKCGIIDEL